MDAKQTVINGKHVAYWTQGNTAWPPLLFIHGFRGNHKGLMGVASVFEKHYVIIPDLPGYGESQHLDDEHTFAAYADFFDTFCETLSLPPCPAIGHSFGASLALVFAAHFPKRVTQLVLIAPVIAANTIEAHLGRLFYQTARYFPPFLRRRWIKSRVIDFLSNVVLMKTASRKRRLALMMDGQRNLKKLDENVIMENFLSFYDIPFLKLAKKIKADTLILFGQVDALAPVSTMISLQHAIKRSSVTMMPRLGHIAPLEAPRTVGGMVKQFIEP